MGVIVSLHARTAAPAIDLRAPVASLRKRKRSTCACCLNVTAVTVCCFT